MGKIRIKTIGDESTERAQTEEAKKRRLEKKIKKEKEHVKGVGLKGGQQIKMMEGVELTPEVEKLISKPEDEATKKVRKAKTKVRSKRYKKALSQIDRNKYYDIKKAITLIKSTSTTSFDATAEAHINLSGKIPKDKKTLSGAVNLPHGTGKKRIIAIATDELISRVSNGKIDFDILIAHPSIMSKLAKFAKILGPKGLMPNPKNGTISQEPEKRAKELEGGEITWKTEPSQPIIHQAIGKVSFTEDQLMENLTALVNSIGVSKISKINLSSTMAPGIKVEVTSLPGITS